jgi:hypothetical protein
VAQWADEDNAMDDDRPPHRPVVKAKSPQKKRRVRKRFN